MSHGDGGSTKHSQRTITVGRFSMWKTDSVMSRNKISQQFQLYHYMIEVISPWADSKSHSQPVRSCQRFTWWTWIERTNLPCSPPPIAAAVLWIEFSIAQSMSITGLQNSITCSSHLWCVSSDITAGCTDVSLTFVRGSIVSKLDPKPRKGHCVGQWCSFKQRSSYCLSSWNAGHDRTNTTLSMTKQRWQCCCQTSLPPSPSLCSLIVHSHSFI